MTWLHTRWLRCRDWMLRPYYELRWSRVLANHWREFPHWWERNDDGELDMDGRGW